MADHANQFKAGDQVELKSGGPTMTVVRYIYGGGVQCSWFSGTKAQKESFTEGALKIATPK